jgi:hypothetical protein
MAAEARQELAAASGSPKPGASGAYGRRRRRVGRASGGRLGLIRRGASRLRA